MTFYPTMDRSIATEDFSGAAHLFVTAADRRRLLENARKWGMDVDFLTEAVTLDYIDLNLVIAGVSFGASDFNKVDTYPGDEFGIQYFGRSPIQLSVAATLFDDYGQVQKHRLTRLYRELLRITQVARTGIVVNIEFARAVAQGAFLNLSMAESASATDTTDVQFVFMVFNLYHFNADNAGRYQISSTVFNDRLHRQSQGQLSGR